ncbi:hypothetical protein C5745_14890, partial [Sphingobacterium haloxyli]
MIAAKNSRIYPIRWIHIRDVAKSFIKNKEAVSKVIFEQPFFIFYYSPHYFYFLLIFYSSILLYISVLIP